MGAVVAIGDEARLGGFTLAGVTVLPTSGPDDARRAWRNLPAGVDLVILDRPSATALGDAPTIGSVPLVAVLP